MTAVRPGVAAIGSLLSEDFRAIPAAARPVAVAAAAADSAGAPWHLVDVAYGALLGGEPKRAHRVLEDIASRDEGPAMRRHLVALRLWAAQLDGNWYPGNCGAEGSEISEDLSLTPSPGPDETVFVEHVVTLGPVALLTPRAIVLGAQGSGDPEMGVQMADVAIQNLQALVEYGTGIDHAPLVLWAWLAQADLARRTGRLVAANEALAAVRSVALEVGQPAALALTHLAEGDWWATPGSSPEALGFDLVATRVPSPPATLEDLDRAARCYASAQQLIDDGAGTAAPGLVGALRLRLGALAWLRGDATGLRRHAASAIPVAREAGNLATVYLLSIHVLVADLAEGRFGERLTAIGSGWGPPAEGPVADVRRWAEADGSTSWCVGLGRLLQRAGDRWRQQGEADRASLAYLGALHLIEANPRVPSRTLSTEVAKLDVDRNFTARALARLERLLTSVPEVTDLFEQMADVAEEIEILSLLVNAQRSRQRTAAAMHAARGLERVRARLGTLLELARRSGVTTTAGRTLADSREELERLGRLHEGKGLRERIDSLGDQSPLIGMLSLLMRQAHDQLELVEVLIPMSRAEHATRMGRDADAERWFAAALDAAAGSPLWTRLVLISADRMDEARNVADNDVDDDLLVLLALRAGDLRTAAAALERTGVSPDTGPWRVALNGAEIALGLDDARRALALATRGIELHEAGIGRILRDTDRVAACDDPDVTGLYLTAVRAEIRLAEQDTARRREHMARAFELMERSRSLAIGYLLHDDPADGAASIARPWREAAATWAAALDRLLAAIDAWPPGDTKRLLADVDIAETRLRELEARLDRQIPGALSRRSVPPPTLRLATVQDRMPPGTVLLEYQTMGTDLLICAVTTDEVALERLAVNNRRLSALVNTYHRQCADGRGASAQASELASLLLAPVADAIRASSRVVVVPFGPLNLVPVHALPFDGAPLGLTRVVSYAPAAEVGVPLEFDRPVPIARASVVGDPAFDQELHPRLRRLPGATTEARLVAAALRTTDVLIDEEATESEVRKLVEGCNVVHLATHGWLDQLAPYASSLVLAGGDDLSVAELVGMHVAADLVVLSACDTGRGAATLGGDVVGLTRAFLAAGVRRLVVSLWPVDDVTACLTMNGFYEHLTAGVPAAAALAKAQASVHGLDHDSLSNRYAALCQRVGTPPGRSDEGRRRGERPLPAELIDDEEIPAPLDGSAERFWAPFILVGA